MKLRIAAGALLLAIAAPGSAMTAGEFLSRAEPLLKKSKVSLVFSGEARALLRELGAAADRTRTRLDADRAAGRPVAACLPPKGQAKVDATELLAHIRALPPAEKTKSFDQAFTGYVARKYPCRA
jgi:hypothetical protein